MPYDDHSLRSDIGQALAAWERLRERRRTPPKRRQRRTARKSDISEAFRRADAERAEHARLRAMYGGREPYFMLRLGRKLPAEERELPTAQERVDPARSRNALVTPEGALADDMQPVLAER